MIGRTVASYKIVEKIGEGGMGAVYKAQHVQLGRTSAVKFLHADVYKNEKERFLREARSAANLNHPNICTVYEIGEVDGRSFIAMEFVEGETLRSRMKSSRLGLDEVLRIIDQVAGGLRAAHDNKIVHRDIKPDNIMITRQGQVKIMDFGLAKPLDEKTLTDTGVAVGTLAYMSPEQIQGGAIDHRTDIWSLGVMTYEMIAGGLPFKSDYDQALAYSILNLDPKPLSSLRADLPGSVDRLVDKALKKDIEERYRDVSDLIVELERARDSLEKTTGPHREGSRPGPRTGAHEGEMDADGPGGVPKRIGGYKIKQVIGSGGMGTVYVAIQDHPRRTVALKVMRSGIASRSALRRFEYEAQILGRLRNPNIAQVYSAGTHDEDGRTIPYFVMEYIPNARPLVEYAKEQRLNTRQRLQLFAKVCAAVHHGHQKGIIHRDLKPANILVDTHGEPKIIDFGVARATDSDLALTTLQTDIGQLIGTLQYMSPEQCTADPHDLDTRSDVYSLGVLMYELLCERLPYDVQRAPIYEAAKIIREESPPKPSTINKMLRGDVETVALKALEKDRDRRYQSADELKRDIERYLRGESIMARPPTVTYQIRVFARKNRALVLSAVAVLIISVAAAVVSTAMYFRSEASRMEAERRFGLAREGADLLLDGLCKELPDILGTSELQENLLEKSLDHYRKLEKEKPGDLDQQRSIWLGLYQLGQAYARLGGFEKARAAYTQFHESVSRAVKLAPDNHDFLRDLSQSHVALSRIYYVENKWNEEESHLLAAIQILEDLLERDPGSPETSLGLSTVYRYFGELMEIKGRTEDTETYYDKALAINKRLNAQHPDNSHYARELTGLYYYLGCLYMDRQSWEKAKEIFLVKEQLDLPFADRDPGDPAWQVMVFDDQFKLGDVELALGNFEAARRRFMRAKDIAGRLASGDPKHIGFQDKLAVAYRCLFDLERRENNLAAAERNLSKQHELIERMAVIEPERPYFQAELWRIYHRYCDLAEVRGDQGAALEYREKALNVAKYLKSIYPKEPGHSRSILFDSSVLAAAAFRDGDTENVKKWESESLAAYRSIAESGTAGTSDLNEYAWFLLTCNTSAFRDPAKALEVAADANRMAGEKNPFILDTMALACHQTGDYDRAVEIQRRAIEILEASGEPVHEGFRERLDQYSESLQAHRR